MTIQLCNTADETNVINKTIATVDTVTATIKGNSSIINPTLILEYKTPLIGVNYVFIPDWNRYYFVRDMRVATGGRYEIDLYVDVLQSFKEQILKCGVILSDTEQTGLNNYLPSESFVVNCKHKTDIVNFSNGLLDNGEYILITAGG